MLRGRKILCLAVLSIFAVQHCRAGEPVRYAPDPEIERLLVQASQSDPVLVQKSIERLSAMGEPAIKALNWRLMKETTQAGKARWAQFIARCGHGKIGYRVVLELQPDGTGNVTLWSDRALLAECGKKYARIQGEPEPVFDDEVLRYNPYSKVELIKHMSDGMKFLEGRVESRGAAIEAVGMISFKGFDSYVSFGQSFDAGGYNMLAGSTLYDSDGVRTFQYRTTPEEDKQQMEKNLLLFHDVTWEFVLDFKGRISRNNATRANGSKLVWKFNCWQMLSGKALVQAGFDASGLAPRPAPKPDSALPLPPVVQASQPVALVKNNLIRARTYKKIPGVNPNGKDLRERKQLVELDGRDSLPQGGNLKYRWTQTYGPDLELTSEDMAKPLIWLIIKKPGEYRFELLVSQDGIYSKPAEVKVLVDDDIPDSSAAVAQNNPPPAQPIETAKVTETPSPVPIEPQPAAATKEEPKTAAAQESKKPEPPEAAPIAPVAADPAKAKELLAQGEKLMKSFKYDEARTVFENAKALAPDDLDCRAALAEALFEVGKYADALPLFQEQVLAKRSAKAYMSIGHCQLRLRQMQDAMRSYRAGAQIGKDQVEWEPRWQLGCVDLASKKYAEALTAFKEAEVMATKANVVDPRLLRDLTIASHECKQDADALKHLSALEKLGYTFDAQTITEIKKGAEASLATKLDKLAPEPLKAAEGVPKVDTPKTPEAKQAEPAKTAEIKPPAAPAKTDPPQKKPVAVAKPAATAPVNSPPPVAQAKQPAHTEQKKPAADAPKLKPEPAQPVENKVAAAPNVPADVKPPQKTDVKPPEKAPAKITDAPKPPPKKTEPKVVIPRKPMPPVPADFDQAMAAGKRALEEGVRLQGLNTDEAKQKAFHSFDESEAMYRGAWNQKPGDESVLTAFKELSKHVGAIALVRSTNVRAKVKGLVVLDAELSIVPKDRQMYCVWEQVGGEDLGLRPENLAQKKVGVRITRPGVYKFDLAVSDGVRGGNPVSVTVEVVE